MYIHAAAYISPQTTFPEADLTVPNEAVENKLMVVEPKYEGIPLPVLRRMGRAVRFGVGAAMGLFRENGQVDGIIIGTGNGGMEDCIRFLNQIIEYDEGTLTPTNFVQSTPNAIAAQVGLMAKNTGYNITHVHRGHAFEMALLDATMLLKEHPGHTYLLGGVDEISSYNYNIESLGGWYKKENVSGGSLYASGSEGSIAGEGAAMFLVNSCSTNAIASVAALKTLHTYEEKEVSRQLELFIKNHIPTGRVDILLSGENGDARFKSYYNRAEEIVGVQTGIARFKHFTGEYPSVGSAAFWLAIQLMREEFIPGHFVKKPAHKHSNVLIYNNYKGYQHSFILLEK